MVALTGGDTGENFDSLVDGAYGIDVKFSFCDRTDDIRSQHQVAQVRARHQHALASAQTLEAADIEEPFDLLIDAADGLDLAVLIHRTGYGNALFDGNFRKAGKNGVELCG